MVGGRQTISAQGRLGAHERSGLAGTTIRLGVWADQYEIKFYRQLVAPFEKQTGAKVKIEYTDYTTYWTKLPTQLAANTAPDVVLSNNNLSLTQQSHVFANLSPYLASSHLRLSDYLRDPFRLYSYQGGLYVMPVNVTIQLLAYNKNLLQKAGVNPPTKEWTWNDLLKAAIKLTVDKNGKHPMQPGFDPKNIVQWGFWPSYDSESFWDPIIAQNKGTMIDPKTHKYNFENPNTVAALQWMHDLAWKYHVMPGATAGGNLANKVDPFIGGVVGISMQGSYMLLPYQQSISKFAWDVAPLPREKTWATNDGGIGLAINRASSVPQAAWELIRYIVSKPAQTVWGRKREGVPILKSAEPAFFAPPPASAPTVLFEMNHVIDPSLSDAWAATANSLKIQDGIANEMTLLLNNKVSAAKAARVIDTTANPLLSQPG
jgi:multiple sugar transport system substrate-binding protein